MNAFRRIEGQIAGLKKVLSGYKAYITYGDEIEDVLGWAAAAEDRLTDIQEISDEAEQKAIAIRHLLKATLCILARQDNAMAMFGPLAQEVGAEHLQLLAVEVSWLGIDSSGLDRCYLFAMEAFLQELERRG